jgi:hypothetical protein
LPSQETGFKRSETTGRQLTGLGVDLELLHADGVGGHLQCVEESFVLVVVDGRHLHHAGPHGNVLRHIATVSRLGEQRRVVVNVDHGDVNLQTHKGRLLVESPRFKGDNLRLLFSNNCGRILSIFKTKLVILFGSERETTSIHQTHTKFIQIQIYSEYITIRVYFK